MKNQYHSLRKLICILMTAALMATTHFATILNDVVESDISDDIYEEILSADSTDLSYVEENYDYVDFFEKMPNSLSVFGYKGNNIGGRGNTTVNGNLKTSSQRLYCFIFLQCEC